MRRTIIFAVVTITMTQLVGPAGVSADYDRRTAIVEAIAKTRDAIVNLRTLRVIPSRFEDEDSTGRVRGLGTGVLIDPRGYIVTNYHVVEKVDEIEVLTSKEENYRARVVTFDDRADLAILKIEGKEDFPCLPLGVTENPLLGETVIVIGNPYGLENSVSTGIVSAVNRELKLPNGEVFDDLIQTDASINPGNSGGPLVNINGELIGINVAIRSNAQGIGFAIPTRKVEHIIRQIMGGPKTTIADHGIHVESDLTNASHKEGVEHAALRIGKVEPDSPAAKMGFQSGDEILEVAGQAIRVPFDLDRILWGRKFGDTLSVLVRRNGAETKSLSLTFSPPKQLSDNDAIWQYFGVRVREVNADIVRPVYDRLNGGLFLVEVAPGSPAAAADLRPGDILVGLHSWETIIPSNIRFVMQWKDLNLNQPIKYHYIRDGVMKEGRLQMPTLP